MTQQDKIIAATRSWIGTPYQHQASLKNHGCDCLGLVRGVWRECLGEEPEAVPAYASDWAESGGEETLVEAARRHLIAVDGLNFSAGDVLLFRWRDYLPAKHAGIATSATTMTHAQDGHAVSDIHLSPWWLRRLAFVFRFPERV
jgi:NlpC/P60 family putative phage cell wall peptidase